VSAEDLRARLQPLLDAGVKVESVTTPAVAHASLVRQRRALLPDGVVAVLSVNAHATAITVVQGNVVLFARELPWGDQTGRLGDEQDGASRAAFASRVAAELRRSLIYLRQSQKVDVSRVLVCGDLPDLRSLTGPLVTSWRSTWKPSTWERISTLEAARAIRQPPFTPGRVANGAGARRRHGAARRPARPGRQPWARAIRARPARRCGRGGRHPHHSGGLGRARLSVGERDRALERLRRTVGVLEPELRRRDEERRRAAVADAREAAMGAFASQGPRLARLMEAFSLAAPADLALSVIRVEPGVASWRLVVEGQPKGPTPGQHTRRSTAF